MKVLLVGVGTVGEAIARLSRGRPWLERMVLADYDLDRARRVQAQVGDSASHPVEHIDASDAAAVEALARAHDVDLVMNAVDPRFLMPVFRGALAADVDYMDMAVSLSEPHPTDPYHLPGVKLGDRQFELAAEWESPGPSGARRASAWTRACRRCSRRTPRKHLFDEVHEVNVRDGGDLRIEGYGFATVFSIWTTIEECLNPPIVWERAGGFSTMEPFAEPERFIFPEGIGPVECVHVEHEEVTLVPRWLDAQQGDLQVRPGRRVHRRAQDAPQHRPRPQRQDPGQGRRGRTAGRGGGARARPGNARRPHARSCRRGHLGHGLKDGARPRGLPVPDV